MDETYIKVNGLDRYLYRALDKEGQTIDFLLTAQILESTDVAKDIVILNSEKGFIPDTIQLRQGLNYRIHVVNVNEQKRNVSFIVDSFGQHHNTVFSTPKSFQISPKTDGIFSYQCPETSLQGKFVVLPQERSPASTK